MKTSNPGGGTFQDLQCDGRPLYRHVGDLVERLATQTAGTSGYGAVGAVVGATYPEQLAELRAAMPHAWILIPGFGSQGGTAADVAAGFHPQGLGAIVNNSRGIIFAHARKEYADRFGTRWQAAVEAATRDMIAAAVQRNAGRPLVCRTDERMEPTADSRARRLSMGQAHRLDPAWRAYRSSHLSSSVMIFRWQTWLVTKPACETSMSSTGLTTYVLVFCALRCAQWHQRAGSGQRR